MMSDRRKAVSTSTTIATEQNTLCQKKKKDECNHDKSCNWVVRQGCKASSKLSVTTYKPITKYQLKTIIPTQQIKTSKLAVIPSRTLLTTKSIKQSVNDCTQVITIPQFTGTCWFNALLMSLFYSDGIRQYFIDASNSWPRGKLYSMLRTLLYKKYTKTENVYNAIFDRLKPEQILNELHILNPNKFIVSIDQAHKGGVAEYYMPALLKLLTDKTSLMCWISDNPDGVSHTVYLAKYQYFQAYDLDVNGNWVSKGIYSSYWRISQEDVIRLLKSTDILTLTYYRVAGLFNDAQLITKSAKIKDNIIDICGEKFKINSLLCSNFNSMVCDMRHTIAGVTCNNKRFIYNGWIKSTVDSNVTNSLKITPCELMPFDWIHDKQDFCISTVDCNLYKPFTRKQVCFNVKKGTQTYVATRQK